MITVVRHVSEYNDIVSNFLLMKGYSNEVASMMNIVLVQSFIDHGQSLWYTALILMTDSGEKKIRCVMVNLKQQT
jgi:hypothetical protein